MCYGAMTALESCMARDWECDNSATNTEPDAYSRNSIVSNQHGEEFMMHEGIP